MSQKEDRFHKAPATLPIPGDHPVLILVGYLVMSVCLWTAVKQHPLRGILCEDV